jgi:tetratricopeptide (TPR) repeat protein
MVMKIVRTQSKVLLKTLFQLERRGEYAAALDEIGFAWDDIDGLPDFEELSSFEAAEMLLRCGSLIGFEGHIKQIPKAQEKSKDLLTEALSRFIDLENLEKIAECENYLALAYWRTGELVEAETWVEQSFLHNLSESNNVRLYSKVIKSLILLSKRKFEEILLYLKDEESNFLTGTDAGVTGNFYNNYALALQELGQNVKALEYLELAGFYYQQSGHQIYLGTVENNLAQLYKLKGNFVRAHEAIDRATKIFSNIEDRTREGFSLDTKAQIYFDERKYRQALITIETALAIMEQSENCAYLVEILWTKTRILIYLNDISSATQSLFEAVRLAKIHISGEASDNLIKDFERTILEKNSFAANKPIVEQKPEEEIFQLILPPSIAHYEDIRGVRIRNTHSEIFGLPENSLAIAVNEKINRGDLVAATEIETDTAICGIYDADFGIVCLENGLGEPTLFDERDIQILGKIIGVCRGEKTSDGKMYVKPLDFSR